MNIKFNQSSMGSFSSISSHSDRILSESSQKIILIALALGLGGGFAYGVGTMLYHKLKEHRVSNLTISKFSQGIEKFEERIEKNSPLIQRQGYKQIPVLDQTYSQVGEAQCGAHSIKNTLVGIGALFSPPLVNQDWFIQQNIYETLMNYIYDQNSQLDRNDFNRADVGIADIQIALDTLVKTDPNQLNGDLRKFQKICREASSMFSIFNADFQSNYINSFGPLTFNSMVNLSKIPEKQGYFVHGFALGDAAAGHWLTLFVQQDSQGNRHWFGCNSYRNQIGTLPDALTLLNNVIQNAQHHVKSMYNDNYHVNFRRYTNFYFNQDGSLQPDTDKPGQKLQINNEHIEDALKAFEFMQEVGWLQGPLIQNQEINTFVRTLALFAHYMALTNDCGLTVEQKTRFQEIENTLNRIP